MRPEPTGSGTYFVVEPIDLDIPPDLPVGIFRLSSKGQLQKLPGDTSRSVCPNQVRALDGLAFGSRQVMVEIGSRGYHAVALLLKV